MRIFEDDQLEAVSIISWVRHRVSQESDPYMINYYWNKYKKMWRESFGEKPLDEEFRKEIMKLFNEACEAHKKPVVDGVPLPMIDFKSGKVEDVPCQGWTMKKQSGTYKIVEGFLKE